jgi:hypothetical protein
MNLSILAGLGFSHIKDLPTCKTPKVKEIHVLCPGEGIIDHGHLGGPPLPGGARRRGAGWVFSVLRRLYRKREKCEKLQNSIVLSLPEHYLIAVDYGPLRHLTRLWRFITEQRPAALRVCDARRVVVR